MTEGRVYTSYDSRQEFTESLQMQANILFDYYMRDKYPVVLKSAHYIFLTVRALLTQEEVKKIREAIATAQNTFFQGLTYSVYVERVSEVVGLLFDALHAHKLLLPTFDSSEQDESLADTLASGGL